MWALETIGIKEPSSGVYQECRDSISFDGQPYSVKLPWKEGHPDFPTNYTKSLRHLKNQVARLQREPEILAEYAVIIEEQLHTGVIERVVELEAAPKLHYLTLPAVVRKEATTMKNRVALLGDIQKAFLKKENPQDISKIVVYRFCCVVFGLNASPFLLNATLAHHISNFITVDPKFVKKLIDSFYLDDFVGGRTSSSEVANLHSKTVNRMADGGFKLRKWLTNDSSVRERIKKDLIDDVKRDPVSAENVTCTVISRPEDLKLQPKGTGSVVEF
ncbi:uncharacterized protein [Montipora capricornis]|uniref:uncharacterized protein n=1 Tax=Montipora capricornis TaxID=246305 RepID=UPI0035F20E23